MTSIQLVYSRLQRSIASTLVKVDSGERTLTVDGELVLELLLEAGVPVLEFELPGAHHQFLFVAAQAVLFVYQLEPLLHQGRFVVATKICRKDVQRKKTVWKTV